MILCFRNCRLSTDPKGQSRLWMGPAARPVSKLKLRLRPKTETTPAWPPSFLPSSNHLFRDPILLLQSWLSRLHAGPLTRAQAAPVMSVLAPSQHQVPGHTSCSAVSGMCLAQPLSQSRGSPVQRSTVAGGNRQAHVLRDNLAAPSPPRNRESLQGDLDSARAEGCGGGGSLSMLWPRDLWA